MDFYNNMENESLKFKLNVNGIDTNNIETRLILKTTENRNYLFFGKISEDMCIFDLPKLELFEKNDNGNIKFEIVSDDLYFPVWEDNFHIKTKATITLEQMVTDIVDNDVVKPKITASAIINTNKPKKLDEKTVIDKKPKVKPTLVEKQKVEIKKSHIKTTDKGDIKNFDSFFG